jgi:hypothetical protein
LLDFITQHQQEVSSSGSIYNQLDELLNQNELQRQLLNDLYHMFGTASSSSSSIEVLKQQQLIVKCIIINSIFSHLTPLFFTIGITRTAIASTST